MNCQESENANKPGQIKPGQIKPGQIKPGHCSEVTNHLEGLKAQLHEWLEIMSDDPHFAPPAWVMESMWTRLDMIISSLDLGVSLEVLSESSREESTKDEEP